MRTKTTKRMTKMNNKKVKLIKRELTKITLSDDTDMTNIVKTEIEVTDNVELEEKRTMKIKFVGVDVRSRPVFKVLGKTNYFIGSVDKLFNHYATETEIIEYFKNRTNELVYFGASFGCEPNGYPLKENIEFKIIKKSY